MFYIHGNGYIVSSERTCKNFTGVSIEGIGNVNIYKSNNYKVIVTTDSNLQEIISAKVIGDTLQISETSNTGYSSTKLTIDVYTPDLVSIKLKGVGNIKVYSGKTSNLDITLSGVGNIDARNLEAANVNVTLTGTGDINVWATGSLTGSLSGIGNVIYKGNPLIVSVFKTGIGEIKQTY